MSNHLPFWNWGIKSPFGFCKTHTLQHVGVIVLPQHFANDIQSQREKVSALVSTAKNHTILRIAQQRRQISTLFRVSPRNSPGNGESRIRATFQRRHPGKRRKSRTGASFQRRHPGKLRKARTGARDLQSYPGKHRKSRTTKGGGIHFPVNPKDFAAKISRISFEKPIFDRD